jgi:hypothetical protein
MSNFESDTITLSEALYEGEWSIAFYLSLRWLGAIVIVYCSVYVFVSAVWTALAFLLNALTSLWHLLTCGQCRRRQPEKRFRAREVVSRK